MPLFVDFCHQVAFCPCFFSMKDLLFWLSSCWNCLIGSYFLWMYF